MEENDFKILFGLHEDCKVNKTNIKNFEKIVTGAYLVHKEVFRTKKLIPTNFVSGKKVWLSTRNEGGSTWREHIMNIGSLPIIWIHFRYKKTGDTTPFWTYYPDMKNVENDIKIAYAMWEGEFIRITEKYAAKYGVRMKLDVDTYRTTNKWFFRTRGIEILTPIFYKNKDGFDMQISQWDIKKVITQQSNIFLGSTPWEIQKLIKDL